MKCVRYRSGYATTLSSSPGPHKLPVLLSEKWFMAELIGFTSKIAGTLVAVSDVIFFIDETGNQIEINTLVLGIMSDNKFINLLLKNNKLVEIEGEQYRWPKFTDSPKARVVKIY